MQKTRYEQETLKELVENFHIYGEFVQAESIGPGNINHTFLLTMDQGGNHVRYILQCINDEVFLQPDALMDNYVRVTQHLYQKYKNSGIRDISRRCIELIHTRHNCPQALQPYFIDTEGHFWRCYSLIDRVFSLEKVTHIHHARAASAAFARFQKDLSDLPGEVYPTIPDFHDIRLRYR
ncbi:MAG: aminoglycoside phosphotransferase family protein, partial [Spirochaetota bacterium]